MFHYSLGNLENYDCISRVVSILQFLNTTRLQKQQQR